MERGNQKYLELEPADFVSQLIRIADIKPDDPVLAVAKAVAVSPEEAIAEAKAYARECELDHAIAYVSVLRIPSMKKLMLFNTLSKMVAQALEKHPQGSSPKKVGLRAKAIALSTQAYLNKHK
jgi:hypothetical protein